MKEPFFKTEHGVLFSVDCLENLKEIRPNSIDCILADTPLKLGKDYKNGYTDNLSNEDEFRGLPFEERIEKTLEKKTVSILERRNEFEKYYEECVNPVS